MSLPDHFFKSSILLLFLITGIPVNAQAQYLDAYKKNPYHKTQYSNCGLCHVSSSGGGSRNKFGDYYAAHGHSFSRSLMNAFPQYFNIPEGGFITGIDWNVVSVDLTPTVNGSLSMGLNSRPTNLADGSSLKFKLVVPKTVLQYVTFSATTGSISFDSQSNSVNYMINLKPTASLSSPSLLRQLAKKPKSFKITVIPYDNDGKTLIKDQQQAITFYAHAD